MLSSNCGVCGTKKSRFIKEQEATGILGSILNILGKIHIVGHIFLGV